MATLAFSCLHIIFPLPSSICAHASAWCTSSPFHASSRSWNTFSHGASSFLCFQLHPSTTHLYDFLWSCRRRSLAFAEVQCLAVRLHILYFFLYHLSGDLLIFTSRVTIFVLPRGHFFIQWSLWTSVPSCASQWRRFVIVNFFGVCQSTINVP